MQALTEQARDIAQHAAKAASPPAKPDKAASGRRDHRGQLRGFMTVFCALQYLCCNAT